MIDTLLLEKITLAGIARTMEISAVWLQGYISDLYASCPDDLCAILPEQNGNLHYVGRVVFDRTGNLLVSIGERSSAEIHTMAQSASSSLGKVIRITTN